MTGRKIHDLKSKNLRKSQRVLKKFLLIIGTQKFIGHDISQYGLSFSFNQENFISLLNQQTITAAVSFLDGNNKTIKFLLTLRVSNLRKYSQSELVYGCKIIECKIPTLHEQLLNSTPEYYPDIDIAPSILAPNPIMQKTNMIRDSYIDIKLNQFLKCIKLIRKESVNENLSNDDFRELVLKLTNNIIESDIFNSNNFNNGDK